MTSLCWSLLQNQEGTCQLGFILGTNSKVTKEDDDQQHPTSTGGWLVQDSVPEIKLAVMDQSIWRDICEDRRNSAN